MEFIDYYAVLGLEETASAEDIKKTYRRLARKFHPDVSKEQNAEARFKEIGEAYAVLGDAEKKREYDELRKYRQSNSEFDIPPEWHHREGDSGFYHNDSDSFSDFFESIFRQSHSHNPDRSASFNGEDIRYVLPITLEEAFDGGERKISYHTVHYNNNGTHTQRDNTLKVTIPKGVIPGQQLRLGGKGHPGYGAGKAGDLFLEIEFLPHETFTIDGKNLEMFLPVSPWEIALGTVVSVPIIRGSVKLTIPKNSKPGQKLRVKGKGLLTNPPGDLFVVLNVKFPNIVNENQHQAYEELKNQFKFDPRNTTGVAA